MLERIELPDQAKPHLDMIRRNLQAEARLINDLLEITRIASGKIQTKYDLTDMHRLIDDIITNSQPSLSNKRLSMSKQLDASECHVWGDITRLQQTLGNIMSNAIKFSNIGGQIIVATKNVNSKLQISITDTGAGIDPEFLTVMFTSFQQGDGRAKRWRRWCRPAGENREHGR
jgi:signal transduction histidine kinase